MENKTEKPSRKRRDIIIILAVTIIACCGLSVIGAALVGDDTEEPTPEIIAEVEERQTSTTPMPTRTLKPTKTPKATETPGPTNTPAPTDTPAPTNTPKPTNTPAPTSTPDPWDSVEIIKPGTHLVGTDIAPGLYMGFGEFCYWERLSGLSGTLNDTIANDITNGQYYVEVSPSDVALSNKCEIAPLDELIDAFPDWPMRETLEEGMYLVGRDIEPGIYRGESDGMCYWARLSGASGQLHHTIANDIPSGQYFVEVQPTDFALHVKCTVNKQ